MKKYKLIFAVFAVVTATTLTIIGCSYNSVDEQAIQTQAIDFQNRGGGLSEIVEDELYRDWYLDFVSNMERNFNREVISEIMEDGQIDEEELEVNYSAFGFSSYSEFKNHYLLQNLRLRRLNDTYSLSLLVEDQVLDLIRLSGDLYGGITQVDVDGDNCGRRLTNCVTLAAAVATSGYIGCAPLIAAGGLPGVICAAAVFVAHVAANDNCVLDYEDCIKN